MIEYDTKNVISFSKKVKHTVRTGQASLKDREKQLKPQSASKSNISKFSQKSKSNQKNYPLLHALSKQKSPYYHNLNNARSQRCNINNEQSAKSTHPNDCWSIETSVQTKNMPKQEQSAEFKFIRKQRSCRQIQKTDIKVRKFSQNVRNVINDYQNLREEHRLQKKLMQMALSQKEMHRLDKIYAVEETQYMIRILNAEKKEKK